MRTTMQRLREAKSARAFVFEVLVVMVGVLLALGAQQVADALQGRSKARAAEQALALEQADAFATIAEHTIVAPCIVAQLDRLEAALLAPPPWKPVPMVTPRGGVIRHPRRSIYNTAWRNVEGDGTLAYVRQDRSRLHQSFYGELDNYLTEYDMVNDGLDRLALLSRPIQLDALSRNQLLGDIVTLRIKTLASSSNAGQLMARLDVLGNIATRASSIDTVGYVLDSDFRGQPDLSAGYCVAHDLPLGDWRAALAKGREDMGYPKGTTPPLMR